MGQFCTERADRGRLPVVQPPPRDECISGPRPCPWETCRYHLGTTGRQRVNITATPLDDSDSCALDVADRGAHTLDEVAAKLELSKSRVQQLEASAVAKILATPLGRELLERLKKRP